MKSRGVIMEPAAATAQPMGRYSCVPCEMAVLPSTQRAKPMSEQFPGKDGPGGGVLFEADVRVVLGGFRGGKENDAAGCGLEGFAKEGCADTEALVGGSYAQIGAIGDESEVGETAGGAY